MFISEPTLNLKNNFYKIYVDVSKFLNGFSNSNLQDSENTEQRIQSLVSSLKHMVYEYICRCLFKVRIHQI